MKYRAGVKNDMGWLENLEKKPEHTYSYETEGVPRCSRLLSEGPLREEEMKRKIEKYIWCIKSTEHPDEVSQQRRTENVTLAGKRILQEYKSHSERRERK